MMRIWLGFILPTFISVVVLMMAFGGGKSQISPATLSGNSLFVGASLPAGVSLPGLPGASPTKSPDEDSTPQSRPRPVKSHIASLDIPGLSDQTPIAADTSQASLQPTTSPKPSSAPSGNLAVGQTFNPRSQAVIVANQASQIAAGWITQFAMSGKKPQRLEQLVGGGILTELPRLPKAINGGAWALRPCDPVHPGRNMTAVARILSPDVCIALNNKRNIPTPPLPDAYGPSSILTLPGRIGCLHFAGGPDDTYLVVQKLD